MSIAGLILDFAVKLVPIVTDAIMNRTADLDALKAQAYAAVDELFLKGISGLRDRVLADDTAAISEELAK